MNKIFIYLLAVNTAAFILFMTDKRRAEQKKYRISEKMLIGISALGGSAGALTAMHIFRHKTRKKRFRYGIPVILIIQAILLLWIEAAAL